MRRAVGSSILVIVTMAAVLAAPGAGAQAPTPASSCGPELVAIGDGLCTHGGDRAPSGLEVHAARAQRPPAGSIGAACPGDGVRGRRIRAYYGYPSDTEPRASTVRPWIRRSVSFADSNLDAQTPGSRGQHLRMYCENGRTVTATPIALVPIGGDGSFTFSDVIASLVDRVELGLGPEDLDTPRYTHVVFVDNVACCYGPAGQGTIYYDDRADPALNLNNRTSAGPRFAMVEVGSSTVSGAYVFLHEVGHTLGAVQHSGPHASGAGHCYTSADVMCYADGGPWFDDGGTMAAVCSPMPDGQYPFDCRGDDYYDTDPGAASYLATHWNTADSGWMTPPG